MATEHKTPPAPTPPPHSPEPTPDVDENLDESFPASDPPSWTPTRSEPDTDRKPAERDPKVPGSPREKRA
jgi:hypothetical protein